MYEIILLKEEERDGEDDSVVNCLPCRSEDPSVDLQELKKKGSRGVHFQSQCWRWRQDGSRVLLAHLATEWASSRFSQNPVS